MQSAQTASNSTPTRRLLGVSLEAIVATLLGAAITLALSLGTYALLDVSLGTVFAAVFLSGLFAIGMSDAVANVWEWGLVSAAVGISATVPVLLGLFDHPELALAAAQLVLLCLVLAAGMIAMTRALARLVGRAGAGAVVVLVLLAWLVWPVWMSPYFETRIGVFFVDHLLAHQPLFAIGGAYRAMGDWTHSPIAYSHLTNLGQDVMFAPPGNAWASIGSHAVAAAVLGALAFIKHSDRRSEPADTAPNERPGQ